MGTPRALAKWAEIVVNMLADDAASDAVHRGPDGMFAARGGKRRLLEMGTMSLDHIAALRADAPDGVGVVDAPVSRDPGCGSGETSRTFPGY